MGRVTTLGIGRHGDRLVVDGVVTNMELCLEKASKKITLCVMVDLPIALNTSSEFQRSALLVVLSSYGISSLWFGVSFLEKRVCVETLVVIESVFSRLRQRAPLNCVTLNVTDDEEITMVNRYLDIVRVIPTQTLLLFMSFKAYVFLLPLKRLDNVHKTYSASVRVNCLTEAQSLYEAHRKKFKRLRMNMCNYAGGMRRMLLLIHV